MSRLFTTLIIFLAGLSPLLSIAQTAAMKALEDELSAVTSRDDLAHGRLGFVLLDVESGKTLLAQNPDETLLPASTMKTVTAAAALGILGENYRFETLLQQDGEIVDGVLKGNLYIKGGGDPTFGSDRFGTRTDKDALLALVVKALQAKGIRSVTGRVVGDASCFETAMLPTTWVWSDIGNYYGAGPSGLSFLENTYYVYFKPSETVGGPAELLRTEPEIPGMTFENEMLTGSRGSGDQGYIYGAPYTDMRYLRGTVPQGKEEFSIKGSIPEPAWYAAHYLTEGLRAAGIAVGGDPSTVRRMAAAGEAVPESRKTLFTHQSPSLKEIVYWLNKKSVNLYAEHLVKAIGLRQKGLGSTEAGTAAIEAWWRQQGVDTGGMHLMDGSGLSRYNGITAKQLASMLRKNASQTWFAAFYESLPIAGNASDPGTIRNMCKGTAAANNVRAKSGYIARVRAYAGYADTQSGKRVAFAMLANNFTCKASQMRDYLDGLMVKIAELD